MWDCNAGLQAVHEKNMPARQLYFRQGFRELQEGFSLESMLRRSPLIVMSKPL
jgi:hypothetical protein